VRHARGFSIRYAGGRKVVDVVDPFGPVPDTARYVLVPRGKPRPDGAEGATVVEIPIRTLVCQSTTHLGLTGFLEAHDRIVGLADTGRVLNEDVKARIRSGSIREVGRNQALSAELVLSLSPDLLMTVGFPGRDIGPLRTLVASGIPVITNSEWMEPTPLGRAEWVKLLAAFLDMDEWAEAKFAEVEKEYEEIRRLAAAAGSRPRVFAGIGRKGTWTVPGGRSYVAALLRDAGGEYPWADDTSSGSRHLGFESVYQAARDADCWVNAGWAGSLRDLIDEDRRLGDFRAVRAGRVFNNTKRMGVNGSNEYWETGLINPHLLLADFVRILHPSLLPAGEFAYTRRLE
jgi:iron complex transport system substrate-binding protein